MEEYQRRVEIIESSRNINEAAKLVGTSKFNLAKWCRNNDIEIPRDKWDRRRVRKSDYYSNYYNNYYSNTILKDLEIILELAAEKGYIESDNDIMRIITGIHKLNRLRLVGDNGEGVNS